MRARKPASWLGSTARSRAATSMSSFGLNAVDAIQNTERTPELEGRQVRYVVDLVRELPHTMERIVGRLEAGATRAEAMPARPARPLRSRAKT